jgi:hypothetical protein
LVDNNCFHISSPLYGGQTVAITLPVGPFSNSFDFYLRARHATCFHIEFGHGSTREFGGVFWVGIIPPRNKRLPVRLPEPSAPEGVGGDGSWMLNSFSRSSALGALVWGGGFEQVAF